MIIITKSEKSSNNKEEITNDNTKKVSQVKKITIQILTMKLASMYMFNRTQRMKLGSEPSKYGEYYSTAEEAIENIWI